MASSLGRRRLLTTGAGLVGAAVASPFLEACGSASGAGTKGDAVTDRVTTHAYGKGPSQRGELYRPSGTSRGVVVVIHGGYWRSQYDLTLGQPLAKSLASHGWTAWNIEYRRVGGSAQQGGGGGWPETLDDVDAAIDHLATLDVDTSKVVTLGHSAGGQLAVWAAARGRFSRWSPARVPVHAAIAQAGVLDMTDGYRLGLGGGAIGDYLGGSPQDHPERYAAADCIRQVPLDVPVRCVHGRSDDTVPISQSERYVAAATKAGASATLTKVDGDHFTLIDPSSAAWTTTLGLLDDLA